MADSHKLHQTLLFFRCMFPFFLSLSLPPIFLLFISAPSNLHEKETVRRRERERVIQLMMMRFEVNVHKERSSFSLFLSHSFSLKEKKETETLRFGFHSRLCLHFHFLRVTFLLSSLLPVSSSFLTIAF